MKAIFYSNIHVIPWITAPFITYLLKSEGQEPQGQWLSMREMGGGRERYPLFRKRTEGDLCTIADSFPGFFADIARDVQRLGGGKPIRL